MSICQMCVFGFVKKLIEIENFGIDISEFSPVDLLFFIGEKKTNDNIINMTQAKEQFYTEKKEEPV